MRGSRDPEGPMERRPGGNPATVCDVCGGPTYEARCKILCLRCGYTRDCSDP